MRDARRTWSLNLDLYRVRVINLTKLHTLLQGQCRVQGGEAKAKPLCLRQSRDKPERSENLSRIIAGRVTI